MHVLKFVQNIFNFQIEISPKAPKFGSLILYQNITSQKQH